ncbi:MAG TPA: phenylacetate--CoA ligase family protein, partial [Microvirga sp.]|nr:phenylacetate--CoA ligase family protein [Microvirga sp.]
MADHYDELETRDPALREAALFDSLPNILRNALEAPAYAERLKGIDVDRIRDRKALADLPVLRKADLPGL